MISNQVPAVVMVVPCQVPVPALALGSLPRASGLRGPHISEKGAHQAAIHTPKKVFMLPSLQSYTHIHRLQLCMNNINPYNSQALHNFLTLLHIMPCNLHIHSAIIIKF